MAYVMNSDNDRRVSADRLQITTDWKAFKKKWNAVREYISPLSGSNIFLTISVNELVSKSCAQKGVLDAYACVIVALH